MFFFVSHISSIFQNIRGSPWSHNWAHSSPTRNYSKIWYVHRTRYCASEKGNNRYKPKAFHTRLQCRRADATRIVQKAKRKTQRQAANAKCETQNANTQTVKAASRGQTALRPRPLPPWPRPGLFPACSSLPQAPPRFSFFSSAPEGPRTPPPPPAPPPFSFSSAP